MAATALNGETPRRACEDLALETGRFMEELRQEVLALMTESIKRSASFCASLCAERLVAARRELQLRMAEERQEFELRYSLQASAAARDDAALRRAKDPAAASLAAAGTAAETASAEPLGAAGAWASAGPGGLPEWARAGGAAPRWRAAPAAPSPRRRPEPPRDERAPLGGQARPASPARSSAVPRAAPASSPAAASEAAPGRHGSSADRRLAAPPGPGSALLVDASQQVQALEENTSRLAIAFQAMENLERTLQVECGRCAPCGSARARDDRSAPAASPRPSSHGGRCGVAAAPARAPPSAGGPQDAQATARPAAPGSARASVQSSPAASEVWDPGAPSSASSAHQPRAASGAASATGERTAFALAGLPLPDDDLHVGT